MSTHPLRQAWQQAQQTHWWWQRLSDLESGTARQWWFLSLAARQQSVILTLAQQCQSAGVVLPLRWQMARWQRVLAALLPWLPYSAWGWVLYFVAGSGLYRHAHAPHVAVEVRLRTLLGRLREGLLLNGCVVLGLFGALGRANLSGAAACVALVIFASMAALSAALQQRRLNHLAREAAILATADWPVIEAFSSFEEYALACDVDAEQVAQALAQPTVLSTTLAESVRLRWLPSLFPSVLGAAWQAAIPVAAGALLPVLVMLWGDGWWALAASAAVLLLGMAGCGWGLDRLAHESHYPRLRRSVLLTLGAGFACTLTGGLLRWLTGL